MDQCGINNLFVNYHNLQIRFRRSVEGGSGKEFERSTIAMYSLCLISVGKKCSEMAESVCGWRKIVTFYCKYNLQKNVSGLGQNTMEKRKGI